MTPEKIKKGLNGFTVKELRSLAKKYNVHVMIKGYSTMKKADLVDSLMSKEVYKKIKMAPELKKKPAQVVIEDDEPDYLGTWDKNIKKVKRKNKNPDKFPDTKKGLIEGDKYYDKLQKEIRKVDDDFAASIFESKDEFGRVKTKIPITKEQNRLQRESNLVSQAIGLNRDVIKARYREKFPLGLEL